MEKLLIGGDAHPPRPMLQHEQFPSLFEVIMSRIRVAHDEVDSDGGYSRSKAIIGADPKRREAAARNSCDDPWVSNRLTRALPP